jgi:hypothetical protein
MSPSVSTKAVGCERGRMWSASHPPVESRARKADATGQTRWR